MASSVIQAVLDLEEKSVMEIENARQKADKLLISEKKKARSAYEKISEDAKAEVLLMEKQTEEEIVKLGNENKDEYNKEIKTILTKANEKQDKAIEIVINKLFYQE